jgi:cell fate regulator YaaT (PSP1 superfamily)
MKEKMPKERQQVSTAMGVASVVEVNPMKETVLVELESKATVELPLSEVTIKDKPPVKGGK